MCALPDRTSRQPLLIVAQSGRMLAERARKAGFLPYVIDCYADVDTRYWAAATLKVTSLSVAELQSALSSWQSLFIRQFVYGSGFETLPDSLAYLQDALQVLGNAVAVFRAVQDKPAFFQALDRLDIPYPEVCYTPPTVGDWLHKPWYGQGGIGIRRAADRVASAASGYWQRFLPGEPMSVLFLAAGKQVKIVGFNRQYVVGGTDQPFTFAGVDNWTGLSADNRVLLQGWVEALARVYGLRGLNGLDFILVGGRCYALELNARPPASLALYGDGLIAAHIAACRQAAVAWQPESQVFKAHRIIYADQDLQVPSAFAWPCWAADLPASGAFIRKGRPVCSMIAAGKNPEQVLSRLRRYRKIIEQSFIYR